NTSSTRANRLCWYEYTSSPMPIWCIRGCCLIFMPVSLSHRAEARGQRAQILRAQPEAWVVAEHQIVEHFCQQLLRARLQLRLAHLNGVEAVERRAGQPCIIQAAGQPRVDPPGHVGAGDLRWLSLRLCSTPHHDSSTTSASSHCSRNPQPRQRRGSAWLRETVSASSAARISSTSSSS